MTNPRSPVFSRVISAPVRTTHSTPGGDGRGPLYTLAAGDDNHEAQTRAVPTYGVEVRAPCANMGGRTRFTPPLDRATSSIFHQPEFNFQEDGPIGELRAGND